MPDRWRRRSTWRPSLARPGDAVVLSPGCASFDWYSGYPARGDDFRRLVKAHIAGATQTIDITSEASLMTITINRPAATGARRLRPRRQRAGRDAATPPLERLSGGTAASGEARPRRPRQPVGARLGAAHQAVASRRAAPGSQAGRATRSGTRRVLRDRRDRRRLRDARSRDGAVGDVGQRGRRDRDRRTRSSAASSLWAGLRLGRAWAIAMSVPYQRWRSLVILGRDPRRRGDDAAVRAGRRGDDQRRQLVGPVRLVRLPAVRGAQAGGDRIPRRLLRPPPRPAARTAVRHRAR